MVAMPSPPAADDGLAGRFNYFLLDGISDPLPAAETGRGLRTVLTLLLLAPPQKN